jgi:hypothetical protein
MFLSVEVIGMWYERGWQWAREHLTITVPGVVLIFAATYVLMLAVNAGEAGATWVGAIGSVGAILGGFAGLYFQQRHQQHEQDRRAYALMNKALECASIAVACVGEFEKEYLAGQMFPARIKYYVRLLDSSLEDVALITYTDIDCPDVARAWLNAKRTLVLTRASLIDLLAGETQIPHRAVGKWNALIKGEWHAMSAGITNYAMKRDHIDG